MAFGQQSGPPAQHRQLKDLLGLLENAGFADFRDARGAMGFTQRQAGGKFTVGEAEAFIEQLENAAHTGDVPTATAVAATAVPKAAPRRTASDKALGNFTSEQLAGELQRRGWAVIEP